MGIAALADIRLQGTEAESPCLVLAVGEAPTSVNIPAVISNAFVPWIPVETLTHCVAGQAAMKLNSVVESVPPCEADYTDKLTFLTHYCL